MDLFDLIYNNIYTIDKTFDRPNNFEEIRKEIISIIKENNLSLSQSAMVFNSIIKKLGNTPINKL
ncbi:hypothetical protein [Agathobacter rectalis]|uniref:hypothetical protein n=1 Tax=Agathobacter rectalis TaxID=39491 RepID=UPI00321A2462